MVIGPTPPGTGVIQAARSLAAAKSTSPTSLPSAPRLMPTSMTIAPCLIQSPWHEMRLADAGDDDVGLAHQVRAGRASPSGRSSPCSAPSAAPAPSAGRRCSTGRSRPRACRRGPRRSRRAGACSRTACTDAASGVFSTSRPMLYGWKPSTSLRGSIASITRSADDVRRQRQLHEDAVDRGSAFSASMSASSSRFRSSLAGRSNAQRSHADAVGRPALVAHVDLRGRVLADQHDGEPGGVPTGGDTRGNRVAQAAGHALRQAPCRRGFARACSFLRMDAEILTAIDTRLRAALASAPLTGHVLRVDGVPVGILDAARARVSPVSPRSSWWATTRSSSRRACTTLARAAPRSPRSHANSHAKAGSRHGATSSIAASEDFGAPPAFVIERAAARYFGIRTWAAHVNGVVRDAGTASMWFARRSEHKAIDPGHARQSRRRRHRRGARGPGDGGEGSLGRGRHSGDTGVPGERRQVVERVPGEHGWHPARDDLRPRPVAAGRFRSREPGWRGCRAPPRRLGTRPRG